MTRLVWGESSQKNHEQGVERAVFYPKEGSGRPWNGIVSIEETPLEQPSSARYYDGQSLGSPSRPSESEIIVEALSHPREFDDELMRPWRREKFGLSYCTRVGESYLIHIFYECLVLPNEQNYQYDNLSLPKWNISSKGVPFEGTNGLAHLIVDPRLAYADAIQELEDLLYGSDANDAYLPPPERILEIFEENSILRIIDNHDGTWTAIGPDEIVSFLDSTTFQINAPSVHRLDSVTYRVQSY